MVIDILYIYIYNIYIYIGINIGINIGIDIGINIGINIGIHSMKLSVLLRLLRFRDARMDPSRQAITDEPNTSQS